jgi:hypothetical protein
MKRLAFVVAVLVVTACPAGQAAAKARSNYPYVQSGPDGVFYARCIPAGADGTEGTTTIYRVQKDADQVVDTYDWYSKAGVVLGWSPIAGKVAVMSLSGKAASDPDKQVEISFYLGGKLLTSYTTKDLVGWGADKYRLDTRDEKRAMFNVVGCQQIPRTNKYVFTIEIKGKQLRFDILTGKPYEEEPGK